MNYNRIFIIIMDSVGCGVQEDYKKYHDQPSNTLLSIYNSKKDFKLKNLEKFGLSKILFNEEPENDYCAGIIKTQTAGNDTFSSVWETMGVVLKQRFRSEEQGFDNKILQKIKKTIGMPVLCNKNMPGSKLMDIYYQEHLNTGFPILYFANDGIVLFAAHEAVLPPKQLNAMGEKLSQLIKDQNIARVITRPFIGYPGNFTRSNNRKDFVLAKLNLFDSAIRRLNATDIKIIATEHINEILGKPINTEVLNGHYNNTEMLNNIVKMLEQKQKQSVFICCLQDFDTMGHKKDVNGYANKLLEFDNYLDIMTLKMKPDDLLIITADHGCNPIYDIRGHTRELLPLIFVSKKLRGQKWLGERQTLSDIGQTLCANFTMPSIENGNAINEIFF